MEPALVALIMTVLLGGLMKFLEHMVGNNIDKQILSSDLPTPALKPSKKPEAYDCEVYSERLLDEKMVEAGIMTVSDMAVCDNTECPNCEPSRPKTILSQLVESKKSKSLADDIVTKNAAQKKRLFDEAKARIQHRGPALPSRPPEVPEFASCTTYYDPSYMRDFLMWSWVDKDGKVRALKQLIAPRIDTETYWK